MPLFKEDYKPYEMLSTNKSVFSWSKKNVFMKFSKRLATAKDAVLIRTLAQEAFYATYREILSPEQLDYMFDWMYSIKSIHDQMNNGHVYYIGYCEDRPFGYVSIEKEEEDLFHLQKIYILPAMQGYGGGRYLFESAVEVIRSLHPDTPCRMELNVNRYNKALHFYERMGMRIARQGDFDIGNGYYMNDYIMTLDIV